VTEMVTGVDIIKEQIRIAAGEKISVTQDEIKFNGVAIECRVNAEDPDNDFMPSPGKLESLILPGGRNVRVDTHVYPGYEIPPFYDSMIAKIIVHGKDRAEAISIMKRALLETMVSPIKTTIPLHLKILSDPTFLKGEITTHFMESFMKKQLSDGGA
jgi:acetyl-CoA carboxylase biotin carboxylase subunit